MVINKKLKFLFLIVFLLLINIIRVYGNGNNENGVSIGSPGGPSTGTTDGALKTGGFRFSMTSLDNYSDFTTWQNNSENDRFDKLEEEMTALVQENYFKPGEHGIYILLYDGELWDLKRGTAPKGIDNLNSYKDVRNYVDIVDEEIDIENKIYDWFMSNSEEAVELLQTGKWKEILNKVPGTSPQEAYNILKKIASSKTRLSSTMKNFSYTVGSKKNLEKDKEKDYWGYIGMLLTFYQAALYDDLEVAQEMEARLNAYFTSDGIVIEKFPILCVEATAGYYQHGKTYHLTIPQLFKVNTGISADYLYNYQRLKLPEVKGSIYDMIMNAHNHWEISSNCVCAAYTWVATTDGAGPGNVWSAGLSNWLYCPGIIGQGYWQPGWGMSLRGRDYFRTIRANLQGDDDSMWGYGIFYGVPLGDSVAPVPGSYTWELTPDGNIPINNQTELKAQSSTITNWNISQSGHNQNNFDDWISWIISDDLDENKIKFEIYRLDDSEAVPERKEVLEKGIKVPANTTNTQVTDGIILGSKTGKTFPANQEVILTDEELKTMLRDDTGLSYTELISGELPIKVNYATKVLVQVGKGSMVELTNNQVEYVHYYSDDSYTFTSEVRDGYAEIKTGRFDESEHEEPFEAMAGTPTTENLYFASGGKEFVAQITYEFVENADAIRNYHQKYSTTETTGWFDVQKMHPEAGLDMNEADSSAAALNLGFTEGENQRTCSECAFIHQTAWEPVKIVDVRWNWSATASCGKVLSVNADGSTVNCPGGSKSTPDSATGEPATCSCGAVTTAATKGAATRWNWDFKAKHKYQQYNSYDLQWVQNIKNFSYAKLTDCKVWRIENARVENLSPLTMDEDEVMAEVLAVEITAIFNAAGEDTAAEGRLYHSLHPEDGDNFVFKATIPVRGCIECYEYNAGEDLIKSAENPNALFNNTWSVSDYLILQQTKVNLSLLYYEYDAQNTTVPIAELKISGNPQDNRFDLIIPDVTFDEVNPENGTEEAVCFASTTFMGDGIEPDELVFGGYNGKYSSPATKYSGLTGYHKANITLGSQVIFKTGYKHNNQGLVNGFTNSSPQVVTRVSSKLRLVYNDIDVHDYDVKNGEYSPKNSTIFYENIINYGDKSPIMSVGYDDDYDKFGFQVDTTYSSKHTKVNNIVIHNPVSAQYAGIIPVPDRFDQRTMENPSASALNIDYNVCPGDAGKCNYSHLFCTFAGTTYHTDECYVKVSGGGLATIPVEGKSTTVQKPVAVPSVEVKTQTFNYSSSQQSFQAPVAGDYTFTLYGASGGADTSNNKSGGEGGITKGTVTLTAGQTIYIRTGGQGSYSTTTGVRSGGINGGGGTYGYGGGGGGMTFISTKQISAGESNRTSTALTRNYTIKWYHTSGCTYAYQTHTFTSTSPSPSKCAQCDHSCGYLDSSTIIDDIFSANGLLMVAGGGGGSGGNGVGGAGGGSIGATGGTGLGTPGAGGTQTAGGVGGSNHGMSGLIGSGGSNTSGSKSGGGGGGGGYYGGGAGGNDYSSHNDLDDAGGGGGSSYVASSVKNTTLQQGGHTGNGKVVIEWEIETTETIYIPVTEGTYTYDSSQAQLFPHTGEVQVFTAPSNGTYSIHAYGAAGGGDEQKNGSRRGLGGYAGGTINLKAGQTIFIYSGGQGTRAYQSTGTGAGWNGGGHGGMGSTATSAYGFGGGGASDIRILNTGGKYTIGNGMTKGTNTVTGPGINVEEGIYQVDIYGSGLTEATPVVIADNTTLTSSIIKAFEEDTHISYYIEFTKAYNSVNFNVNGAGVSFTSQYISALDDRILVAGGGGGADDTGGTKGGSNDGAGGAGGGLSGEDAYIDGTQKPKTGATQSTGYKKGLGQSTTITNDSGGGGGGWYGGVVTNNNNGGGGGGSGYIEGLSDGVTENGQNDGNGYVVIIYPGKGETVGIYILSCNEPHHSPSSYWARYTTGWTHQGGFSCTGIGCLYCGNNVDLYSPNGTAYTPNSIAGNTWVISHNGALHLTNESDGWCEQCAEMVEADRYTEDNGKTYKESIWKTTNYDGATINTSHSTTSEYHYSFGDSRCWEACMDDENHKKNKEFVVDGEAYDASADFLILDRDFTIYFPNIGDFYGDGANGISQTTNLEGKGYEDAMDTTKWLKKKYVTFTFDVMYEGKTYIAGEQVFLGRYDEASHTWFDDSPTTYQYVFHCLLDNSESYASQIAFHAVAKNSPYNSWIENTKEDRNYSRTKKYAYHDARQNFYIDVLGRIGVLALEDTGDFRFANLFKETTSGWIVDNIVKTVDYNRQNYVLVDKDNTILGDAVSTETNGQNTHGNIPWLASLDKLLEFPLAPTKNNIPALRSQAHRVGYKDYLSLNTIGNYYGENGEDSDLFKVQVTPYYYFLNLDTGKWTPMDVYIKLTDRYALINKFDNEEPVADYNFYYDLNWVAEQARRNYIDEERRITEDIHELYRMATADEDEPAGSNIKIPAGTSYLHGTAQRLFLKDRNRTFVGSSKTYGIDYNPGEYIPEFLYERQAQRWHFTLGLPSSAVFVARDKEPTNENIKAITSQNGVIVCALDIIAKGEVWTLKYDGTPLSDQKLQLLPNGKTYSYGNNPDAPGSKRIVLVYEPERSSRNDLTTEGTH